VLAALLAVLLLLTACAEVNRTVTAREVVVDDGDPHRVVVWESNRYPRFEALPDDSCWSEATIGQPPPEACLTTDALASEADPFRWSRGITTAGALLAIGSLVWFATRRIGWQPTVDSTTAGDAARRGFNSADAVSLMRGIEREKEAQHIASGSRRDLGRPALVGFLIALAALLPLVGLLGWGMGLGWGVVTGVFLILGVGGAFVVLLVPLPPMPADHEAYTQRLLFFTGAAVGLLVISGIGLLQRAPLVELHGLAWLG
jgi:hypothetical protein